MLLIVIKCGNSHPTPYLSTSKLKGEGNTVFTTTSLNPNNPHIKDPRKSKRRALFSHGLLTASGAGESIVPAVKLERRQTGVSCFGLAPDGWKRAKGNTALVEAGLWISERSSS